MLFDPRPKTSAEELFDRERELGKLRELKTPVALVLGVRRVGKTSLVCSFLNTKGIAGMYIDCREMTSSGTSTERLTRVLWKKLTEFSIKHKIVDVLKRVGDIGTDFFKVSLSKEFEVDLVETFKALDGWARKRKRKVYVVFDEAQNLRFFKRAHGVDFSSLFAHLYDHTTHLRLILTGSEMGVLREFLGMDDPRGTLYGRYLEVIELKPFDKGTSEEFLRRGLEEHGFRPAEAEIKRVVDVLDGIVGWLTYFGNVFVEKNGDWEEALKETIQKAELVIGEELDHLEKLSVHYLNTLKAIARGNNRWASIREYVSFLEGRRIPDESLNRALKSLQALGYVAKDGEEYSIIDPLVLQTLRKR